ncbi:MAG: hypothetical protein H6619_03190 [Deltaproteobacteria bacterium]|nr:hypothetical protein [Deltaproteobacteria bacterium]
MRKEYALFSVVMVVGTIVCGTILWFIVRSAAQTPQDMKVVQLDQKIPAFYDSVFRTTDFNSTSLVIVDPIVGVRGKPFLNYYKGLGPHDALGFRNVNVPRVADIVTIGDSQTYGNNVLISDNWPSLLTKELPDKQSTVYNMSIGGWAAPQYLDAFKKALFFQPKVIVVAIYTGNDFHESYKTAYSIAGWKPLRPSTELTIDNLPKVAFPPPKSERQKVIFNDGYETEFTIEHRLVGNDRSEPAILAGVQIVKNVIDRIAALASKVSGVKVFVTIVPTKETVYSKRVKQENIQLPDKYNLLVTDEGKNSDEIKAFIQTKPNLTYIEIAKALIENATSYSAFYPENENGHPNEAGHGLIAKVISEAIKPSLDQMLSGLIKVLSDHNEYDFYYIKDGMMWFVNSELIENKNSISEIKLRELALFTPKGVIRTKSEIFW